MLLRYTVKSSKLPCIFLVGEYRSNASQSIVVLCARTRQRVQRDKNIIISGVKDDKIR